MGVHMDQPTLILRGSQDDVLADLAVINQLAAAYWKSQGYTVVNTADGKAVLGKNALTGVDNPAATTTTWAIPSEVSDGTYYIPSPSNYPAYSEWRERGISIGYTWKCTEEVMSNLPKSEEPILP